MPSSSRIPNLKILTYGCCPSTRPSSGRLPDCRGLKALAQAPHYASRHYVHTSSPAKTATIHRVSFRRIRVYASLVLALAAAYGAQQQLSFQRRRLLDSPPSREPITAGVKVEITGKDHDENVDKASTGISKIPFFPRGIWLPRSGGAAIEGKSAALPAGIGPAREEEEYHLLGLGVRTVSFLSIQVYVVGLYVAKGDLGRLQQELIKVSVPEGSNASTLVQGEKDELKKRLLDGPESEKIWNQILEHGGIRSAVRIVPVRDTNFSHLRDGWLRGIDMRGKGAQYAGDDFKSSVNDFKALLGGRGSVGKGRVMLLGRGDRGDLRVWVEEGAASAGEGEQNMRIAKGDRMELLGRVDDERLSRLVWLGYLAGPKVASEAARQSVVEGVVEVVERPSGTLETQVL